MKDNTLDQEAASAANDERIVGQVHDIVHSIPAGKVMSYGAVGKRCDPPISGYICGRIMNGITGSVPWWRVVAKDGALPVRKRSPELSAEQRGKLEAEGVGFDGDDRIKSEYFVADQLSLMSV